MSQHLFPLVLFASIAISLPASAQPTPPPQAEPGVPRDPTPTVPTPTESGPADPASAAALSQAILAETNRLRADPAAYAAELAAMEPYYDGTNLQLPEWTTFLLVTQEGWTAVADAIADLETRSPLPPLQLTPGMSLAARDHAIDLSAHNLIGHIGTDGSVPIDRVARYGQAEGRVGENVSFLPLPVETVAAAARWHVWQLVVDDGVPDRGHRAALLREDYRLMGAGCDLHPGFGPHGQVCVVTYAEGFTE